MIRWKRLHFILFLFPAQWKCGNRKNRESRNDVLSVCQKMFKTLVRTNRKVRLQPHTSYRATTASSPASTAICTLQYRCQQPPLGDEFLPWSLHCITFQMMKHLSIEWLVVNQLYSQCPQKSPVSFQSFLLLFIWAIHELELSFSVAASTNHEMKIISLGMNSLYNNRFLWTIWEAIFTTKKTFLLF